MDENLKIVLNIFQEIAALYRRFVDKKIQLDRTPFVKETAIDLYWQAYEKDHKGLVNLQGIIVDYYVEAEIVDRPPIYWGIEISRDEEFVYCEGRVYTNLDTHYHYWLEIDRKANELKQFLADLNETADQVLNFPVPDALLRGEIKRPESYNLT
jgi:hypothetical protein